MRTLGIDPGSVKTGYGVVEERRGGGFVHVDCGIVAPDTRWSFADRLHGIGDGLRRLIRELKPEAVSIETLFHAKNAQSAMKLAHARGVAMMVAAEAGLAVFEYTAGQIKQATVGHGRAEKQQVAEMVRVILGLKEVAQEDASDALAAAICHLQFKSMPQILQLKAGR
ncbi:MAG: crossover junction endodeoxyribonuclease RuvC [Deltaproteobacteria bacterium]|nr:crossover junction endodeoxyribonuclease RuvC [Deltaproteobacteria bacterium]